MQTVQKTVSRQPTLRKNSWKEQRVQGYKNNEFGIREFIG